MEYLNLNQQLVKKPYPLPRIGNMMHHLEGFHYDIALDINIVYYTIRISPAIQDMEKISTEGGKFRYNFILMVMCASGYIFQVKVDKILSDTNGVKTYIDGILLLIKEIFSKHIENTIFIFSRVCTLVLKVNAPRYRFAV